MFRTAVADRSAAYCMYFSADFDEKWAVQVLCVFFPILQREGERFSSQNRAQQQIRTMRALFARILVSKHEAMKHHLS